METELLQQSSEPTSVGSELHTCAKAIQEVKRQIRNPWKVTGKQLGKSGLMQEEDFIAPI